MPRLLGALPILRPDPRPWPYAAVPPITMLQVERQLVGELASAGLPDPDDDDGLLPGGLE